MKVDGALLRSTMTNWISGVAIVTTTLNDLRHGMTISSFLSVSLDPPVIAISANCASQTCSSIQTSGNFAVNILAQGQEGLARLFSDKKKQDVRFAGLRTESAVTGAPLLGGCVANIDCSVTAVHIVGDHIIFLAKPEAIITNSATPLAYVNHTFGEFCQRD